MQQLLPHGLSYVGAWAPTFEAAHQLLLQHAALLPDKGTQLIAACRGSDAATISVHLVPSGSQAPPGPAEPPQLLDASSDGPAAASSALRWTTAAQLQVVRCHVSLQLDVYLGSGGSAGEFEQVVSRAFQQLEAQVLDPSVVFAVSSSR